MFGSLASGAVLAVGPSPIASASTPAGGQLQSDTFNFTGSAQLFTVPVGVQDLNIVAQGGSGGDGSAPRVGVASGAGGLGATVGATLPVTPGEQLQILVGSAGASGSAIAAAMAAGGSVPGGGYAPPGTGTASGGAPGTGESGLGGGGGADTEVDLLPSTAIAQPLAVAGGGGGGAGGGDLAGYSGGGGGSAGQTPASGGGGSGVGAGSGGAGGQSSTTSGTNSSNPFPAAAGGGGGGGAGYNLAGGGGGLAGTSGGAGDGGGGGGGAGSSYANSTVLDAVNVGTAAAEGDGQVTLSWLAPVTTTTLTTSATSLTAGSPVTLTATVSSSSAGPVPEPTGTVTFEVLNSNQAPTILGSEPLNASTPDTATLTTSALPAGSYTVAADYSGDSVYPPSDGSVSETVAVPAAASVSPSSLSFGPVVAGGTVDQDVTVSNSGPGTLTVSDDSTSGAGFSVASDGCAESPVAPGSQCTIEVQYAPTAAGTNTGQLTVTSNATGSPQ